MNETKQANDRPDTTPAGTKPRKLWRRVAIAGLLGTVILGAGAGAKVWAQGGCGHRGWHAGFRDASPEAMKARTEAMVKWMLADVSATEAQQARVAEILRASMTELRPLREQHLEARKAAAELLAAPAIDRAALEALRARELAAADQASKRLTQAIVDAAEVLTPEQRSQLLERFERMRGRRS